VIAHTGLPIADAAKLLQVDIKAMDQEMKIVESFMP
jgi:hypothetical protein